MLILAQKKTCAIRCRIADLPGYKASGTIPTIFLNTATEYHTASVYLTVKPTMVGNVGISLITNVLRNDTSRSRDSMVFASSSSVGKTAQLHDLKASSFRTVFSGQMSKVPIRVFQKTQFSWNLIILQLYIYKNI